MIIIWGNKTVKDKLGWLAEYCPFCREPRALQLRRHRLVGHLYGVGFGRGTITRHSLRCPDCRNDWPIDPDTYPLPVRKRPENLVDLIGRTNPDLLDVFERRMALEAEAASARPNDPQRIALIREALTYVLPIIERRIGSKQVDLPTGLAFIAAALCVLAAIVAWGVHQEVGVSISIFYAAVLVAVLSVTWFVWAAATGVRRFARRKVFPKLAALIGHLAPDQRELETAMADGRLVSTAVRKALSAERLFNYLDERAGR